MSWLQIAIKTNRNQAETAEDCLFGAGAQTVTLTDAADQPILEPAPNETPVWDTVIVTGLFSFEDNQQAILDAITPGLNDIDFTISTQILEDQNWTRAWMDHFHAMQFGERLWVCPMHQDPPQADAVNLRLDPGLAFGTGTHPTTALCLRWLDQHIQGDNDNTILDYGCGSGILAIAACLLGTAHADAVDIDPQALTATHDNARTNQVEDKITTFLPEDYEKRHANTQYQTVVANILSGPLAELAPMLAAHTRPGGDIALSGILREQADTVLDTYREFFTMDEAVFDEDWVLLHGTKK